MLHTLTHRFGSRTAGHTARTCVIFQRSGYGHATPKVADDAGGRFGGQPIPWFHVAGDGRGPNVDRSRWLGFYTPAGARNALAELRNRATHSRQRPSAGEIITDPLALHVHDDGATRVTVDWRSRDGVEYFDDLVVIDFARSGFVHHNGVVEVGNALEYLSRIDNAARREPGYPEIRWSAGHDNAGWIDTGDVWSDGRLISSVVRCGECGRSWDDAIATSWTPTPSGRCPFEYDHGRSLVAMYT
ncbi:hypothetical protein KNU13_gp86 [Gordonia phage Turuncu]|uniref:Uncharacterized protein n=1 Tax=Gordonia phage Turuncu TaxID=2315610 RepID=A0A386KBL5_9CAUD|nr:hypothetical protein KNU13_gp86 [Gordonia phage Turuncu]AYD82172.1 hypothetical protein SEA_TURUNCU_86 [Gordonia phage Turuncu]